jgi:hypothetical protein
MTVFVKQSVLHVPFTSLLLYPCTSSYQVNWLYQWFVSVPEIQSAALRSPSQTIEVYAIICIAFSILGFNQYLSIQEL